MNYWKAVVASLVLRICGDATTVASSKTAADDDVAKELVEEIDAMGPEAILAAVFVVLSALAAVCRLRRQDGRSDNGNHLESGEILEKLLEKIRTKANAPG